MSQDFAESTQPSRSARSQVKLQQRPARAIRFGHIHADAVTAADAIDRIVDRVRSGEGGYVVTSPFNPVVLTQADSLEEAFENARDVIALFEADRKAERSEKKKVVAR